MPWAENEVRYAKIASLWPRADVVNISYRPALELDIRIPLAFVVTSGQNTVGFVEELAQTLVLESGSLRRSDAPDVELDLTAPLSQPENFVFLPGPSLAAHPHNWGDRRLPSIALTDKRDTSFTERRGPESKTRRKAPPAEENGASSVSHSSRNSTNQVRCRAPSRLAEWASLSEYRLYPHAELVSRTAYGPRRHVPLHRDGRPVVRRGAHRSMLAS
jgi:hypothetical protein